MQIGEKIKEKSNTALIFSRPAKASKADSEKFYKKRGRQRTIEKTKEVIVYRLTKKRWPAGLSEWMQWYYNDHYIKKSGRFYEKTKQWQREIKAAKADVA